jgi:sigma-B regulation protein RsbU (phosphoserine phosphatase)
VNAPEPQELSLTIPADARYLSAMRALVGEAAEIAGFDPDACKDIVLGVCEAVSNIITHCYRGRSGPITVHCRLAGDRLEVRLRDFGPKPDPAVLHGRDLDDVRPGGLGLHIIRRTMDEAEFDFSHPDGTELRLVKYRGAPPERPPDEAC